MECFSAAASEVIPGNMARMCEFPSYKLIVCVWGARGVLILELSTPFLINQPWRGLSPKKLALKYYRKASQTGEVQKISHNNKFVGFLLSCSILGTLFTTLKINELTARSDGLCLDRIIDHSEQVIIVVLCVLLHSAAFKTHYPVCISPLTFISLRYFHFAY